MILYNGIQAYFGALTKSVQNSAKTFSVFITIAAVTIIITISNNNIAESSSDLFSPKQVIHKAQLSVNIINPAPKSTITSNVILVNGTASDSASRIQKVEVLADPYPFSGVFNYKLAIRYLKAIGLNGQYRYLLVLLEFIEYLHMFLITMEMRIGLN